MLLQRTRVKCTTPDARLRIRPSLVLDYYAHRKVRRICFMKVLDYELLVPDAQKRRGARHSAMSTSCERMNQANAQKALSMNP